MPTPKFEVGDVVWIPSRPERLSWYPPEQENARFAVTRINHSERVITFVPADDPHRYDLLDLQRLDGTLPEWGSGADIFALWCQLDPFMTAARKAIMSAKESNGEV